MFITDICDNNNNVIKLNINKFKAYFKLPYAYTNHSCQGCDFDNELVISDINLPYVSRKWAYVALSRVKEFKKLKILVTKDECVDFHNENLFNKYLINKIKNYKIQDAAKFLNYDENDYINEFEFYDMIRKCNICRICK